MPYFGCHLSPSGGYAAMVRTAASLGGDTFQFFTRNPRGSRAKAPDLADAARAGALMKEGAFGPVVAHGAYTMNLCTQDPDARAFAAQVLTEDLGRTALLPGCLYNFHPGSHVGQGLEEGIRQIAAALEGALASTPEACVLLETMAGKGTEIGGRFQELRMILDAVRSPQLHVCLDTCHVWDAGYDIAGSLEGVLEEFDRLRGRQTGPFCGTGSRRNATRRRWRRATSCGSCLASGSRWTAWWWRAAPPWTPPRSPGSRFLPT